MRDRTQLAFVRELAAAVELHRQGKLQQASLCYEQILCQAPAHADALHLLGLVAYQSGRPGAAADLLRKAIKSNPRSFAYHNSLGEALRVQGRLSEARACYQRALRLKSDYPEAQCNLGVVLQEEGKSSQAIAHFRRALHLDPGLAAAHYGLGNALQGVGKHEAALESYEHCLRLLPDSADVHQNKGSALHALGRYEAALASFREALRLQPDSWQAHHNIGDLLTREHALVQARAHYSRALEHNPQHADAYLNRAGAYMDEGDFEKAIIDFQNALRVKPDCDIAHGSLLLSLNYCPGHDAATMFAAHRQWNEQHAAALRASIRPWKNDRDPERRLRLGYVSADLRQHPVGFLLEPTLAAHDKARFEVVCYSDTEAVDDITARMKAFACGWRDIRGKTAEAVSELVRDDGVDILIDLAGHTGGNRLTVFARKPAPVQVSWLGYFNTTGLDTMDYILSDSYSTPPGSAQQFAEQVVLLPHSRFCYRPPMYAPEVATLPARANGIVTFGCFNNLAKLNRSVIALWARVLQAVPGSRLVLKSKFFSDDNTRQRFLDLFQEHGTSLNRLELRVSSPHIEMLGEYGEIDIALDTFPFTGGMTTLEALWMGVPVVTLDGDAMVSRQSASFLAAIGQPELIADSEREYVEIVKALAGDLLRLESLRGALRPLMQGSPLCDNETFARNLEDAYRQMWRNWCEAER